ncbi:hypothetical protein SBA2_590035 [Acidobacteriia bacterium SbA2]|nr:hypothetical protein SBA2_590035 [Acidobacteriia bacterium SbA2]
MGHHTSRDLNAHVGALSKPGMRGLLLSRVI